MVYLNNPAHQEVRPLTMLSRRGIGHRWMHDWRGGLALLAICAVMHLPGIFVLPPIDRDEARFAEATRQMVTGGGWRDYVVPRFACAVRANKPPLIYWIQAPLVALSGVPVEPDQPITRSGRDAIPITSSPSSAHQSEPDSRLFTPRWPTGGIWAYRLASLFGAAAAGLLTWRLGLCMFAAPAAWLGGVLLVSCLLIVFDVRQARADQVLLAFTTLAQFALWRLWDRRRRGRETATSWLVLFWFGMIAGVMTKGPITPAVCSLTVFALACITRDFGFLRALRPLTGAAATLLVIVPWLALMGYAIGFERFGWIILQETVGRAVLAREGHGGPPGYHTLLLPALLWPGSLALAPALLLAFRRGLRLMPTANLANAGGALTRLRHLLGRLRVGRAPELFCLCWLVPSWLLFEFAGTKLPHYPLPVYPALALLCGRALYATRRGWTPVYRHWLGCAALAGWWILGVFLSLGAAAAAWRFGGIDLKTEHALLCGVLSFAAAVLLVLTGKALAARGPVQAQTRAMFATALSVFCLFQILLPNAERIWLSARAAEELSRHDPTHSRPLADAGFHADSLVFLRRGAVTRLEPEDLVEWWKQHDDALLIHTEQNVTIGASPFTELSGFDYSRGRFLTIRLADKRTCSQPSAR